MKLHAFPFVIILMAFAFFASAQFPVEDFSKTSGVNIGSTTLPGSFQFDKKMQTYRLRGAGYNIWFERDEFFFLPKLTEGSFIVTTSVAVTSSGSEPHRKAGIMLRASLDDDAPFVSVAIHGDGTTSLQFRKEKGGPADEIMSDAVSPEFVQLEKSGNRVVLRFSTSHKPLAEAGSVEIDLGTEFFVGPYVCSHNSGEYAEALFQNLRIDRTAEYFGGDRAPASPSRMEILHIETGLREVVFASDAHFEAPNWSRNGKFLVYNQGGLIYRYDLGRKRTRVIDTGFATANNNDHGISFDGKTLAISHHTSENNTRHSIIYTVPLKGGTPRRVTDLGPSYWHGWSPDDQWHVYCAERNGEYDVYKIHNDGGEEIRLTTAPGLDDGPEYSPCGKYIYFNSVRSGTMQIWRMAPDGSNQEQVTFDEYNDWFAHPSPDGKWLIMVSYLPEVPAGSHPRNQRVMLRLMEVGSSDIKAVAFLYGGQGTINVPSWSPDSKRVAFVSYTY